MGLGETVAVSRPSADTVDPFPARVDGALQAAENVIYCLVTLVLIAGAVALLAQSAFYLATSLHEGVVEAVKNVFDSLLLVFILVELLSAVRETMRERKIVAEPFLLIGIIASIKEVVVLAVGAKDDIDSDVEAFRTAMLGVGSLSALPLVLSVAILMVRRKEREPSE
jgi:uncharacterized membrane protein (DUF373 family)